MKNKLFIGLILLAVASTQTFAAKRLIGLFNGLDKKVRIRGKAQNGKNLQDKAPTSGKAPAYISPVTLPAKAEITYNDDIYQITIEEGKMGCDMPGHSRVIAQVTKNKAPLEQYKQTACVTDAVSSVLPGKNLKWGNLMLAIGDNPKYSKGSEELPFRFGISAWTTTRAPWNLPQVVKTADDSVQFQQTLSVMQGFAGIGGGMLPRLGYANIIHLYNNSPFMLMYSSDYRENLPMATSGFNQLVPPYITIPWITTWIPKLPGSAIKNFQKSMIKLYILHPPVEEGEPLPDPDDFEPIRKAGTIEIAEEDKSAEIIKEEVQEIKAQTPNIVNEIMKTKSVTDLISDKYEDYYVSKFYYAITTDSETGKIHIQKCYPDKYTCKQVYVSDKAAFSGPNPGYYKLIIKPTKKNKEVVDVQIAPLAHGLPAFLE